MQKATSETTKLNFITDQGSTRATVRCACRAVRFGGAAVALCAAPRDAAGLSVAALLLPPSGGPVVGGGEFLADVPDRRNARAGDDGECAGGSGISHANAAGETDGGSAWAGRSLADAAEPVGTAEPADEGAPDVGGLSLPGVTAGAGE